MKRKPILIEGGKVRVTADFAFDYYGEQVTSSTGPFEGDIGEVIKVFADGDAHVRFTPNGPTYQSAALKLEVIS